MEGSRQRLRRERERERGRRPSESKLKWLQETGLSSTASEIR